MGVDRPRVAVVLSGGGAKGAYEAGALKAIVRKTKQIHIITGASIGAINAAVFAVEYEKTANLLSAANRVQAVWAEIRSLFELEMFKVGKKMFFSRLRGNSFFDIPSLVRNDKIVEKINDLIPDIRIGEISRIELAINATNMNTGRSVTFSKDASLREAVLASSCIPILFPTRFYEKAHYVDGGLFNNTPLRDAIVAGATHVFVVELKPKDTDQYRSMIGDYTSYESAWQVGTRLLELIVDKIMYDDVQKAKKLNKIISVIRNLESLDSHNPALHELKEAINYEKKGRVKKQIIFHEIAPLDRLNPPGTLGFDKSQDIQRIMKQGESDGDAELVDVLINWDEPETKHADAQTSCTTVALDWKGTLSISRDQQKNLLEELFSCPRCGRPHRHDDPSEIANNSLYCDTFDERVDYPEGVLEKLNRFMTLSYEGLDVAEKQKYHADDQTGILKFQLRF